VIRPPDGWTADDEGDLVCDTCGLCYRADDDRVTREDLVKHRVESHRQAPVEPDLTSGILHIPERMEFDAGGLPDEALPFMELASDPWVWVPPGSDLIRRPARVVNRGTRLRRNR
jgi:hypothetical protein